MAMRNTGVSILGNFIYFAVTEKKAWKGEDQGVGDNFSAEAKFNFWSQGWHAAGQPLRVEA